MPRGRSNSPGPQSVSDSLRCASANTPAGSKCVTRSELQVLADIADLVDEHGAAVKPPHAVQSVKRVLVMPGHDDLQRQFRRGLRDAVVGPAGRGALGLG